MDSTPTPVPFNSEELMNKKSRWLKLRGQVKRASHSIILILDRRSDIIQTSWPVSQSVGQLVGLKSRIQIKMNQKKLNSNDLH